MILEKISVATAENENGGWSPVLIFNKGMPGGERIWSMVNGDYETQETAKKSALLVLETIIDNMDMEKYKYLEKQVMSE